MNKDFTHLGELSGVSKGMNLGDKKVVMVRKIKTGWICSDGHSYDKFGYCQGHQWALDVDTIVKK